MDRLFPKINRTHFSVPGHSETSFFNLMCTFVRSTYDVRMNVDLFKNHQDPVLTAQYMRSGSVYSGESFYLYPV